MTCVSSHVLAGSPQPRLPDLTLALASPPRELSHNQIEELPSLHRCQKLEEM